jgi:putative component of membrane protein insertase Oxa1/YidC/SpoIIIJ protein YidD
MNLFAAAAAAALPIRGYQRFISPALPPSCRIPRPPQYAIEAITKYGRSRVARDAPAGQAIATRA